MVEVPHQQRLVPRTALVGNDNDAVADGIVDGLSREGVRLAVLLGRAEEVVVDPLVGLGDLSKRLVGREVARCGKLVRLVLVAVVVLLL